LVFVTTIHHLNINTNEKFPRQTKAIKLALIGLFSGILFMEWVLKRGKKI